jgi:hypothetical protein
VCETWRLSTEITDVPSSLADARHAGPDRRKETYREHDGATLNIGYAAAPLLGKHSLTPAMRDEFYRSVEDRQLE